MLAALASTLYFVTPSERRNSALRRWGNADSLGLTVEKEFSIVGVKAFNDETTPREVAVRAGDIEFEARLRIDTPGETDYSLTAALCGT